MVMQSLDTGDPVLPRRLDAAIPGISAYSSKLGNLRSLYTGKSLAVMPLEYSLSSKSQTVYMGGHKGLIVGNLG